MLVVSLCLELLSSVIALLLIIKFGVSGTGPLMTDVYTLAGILYFIVLFKSFILLIKHYFVDQRAMGNWRRNNLKSNKVTLPCDPIVRLPGSTLRICSTLRAWPITFSSIWRTEKS